MKRKIFNQFVLRTRTHNLRARFADFDSAHKLGNCPCLAATATEYRLIGLVIIGGGT